jgi:hypothetical protein
VSISGTVLRSTLLRPGRTWRIPFGFHRGLRVVVEEDAPLHTYLGTLEIELARQVVAMVEPGMFCLDIGGHDALDALALAKLSRSHVLTFEFADERLAMMRRNLSLNAALARYVRTVETYVAFETVASPPADTLDRLVAMYSHGERPGLIKMDVEGAEVSVLSGAPTVLAERPHLIIETHSEDLEKRCIELLIDAGYRPSIIDQRRWLPERRGNGHNRWVIAPGRELANPVGAAKRPQ